MPSSRIPSPARSQGAKTTPRKYKPRASRSVGSPARSNTSVKLTTVMQMNSFALSPLPSRRSVLTDTTDIDIPRRKSWWKKLDENSREIMEVLNNKDPVNVNNAIEEYIEVDVLSQEKKNYTLDIPESSDGESINSIVIPQRKLFTQKESKPQKKFSQMIDNRESLAPLHKTHGDDDKTINIGRKNLLNQGTKQRTKPLFPSALLNISANKTIATKTKELATTDGKGQVKNLFGNRAGAKRKNMFADFIVSDSEEDIPEIQPKVFGFKKKQRQSLKSRPTRESHPNSPTSSITDIEMDDWRLLPSSTMVDHQLEDALRATPSKRARLGKLSEAIESVITETNTSRNKTKQSNKSLHSKSRSKNVSKPELIEPNDSFEANKNYTAKEKNKSNTKNVSPEHSLREETFKTKEHSRSKNRSLVKIVNAVACDVSIHKDGKQKVSTLSKIDQVLQSDDDEDFSLVYEHDDGDEVEENRANIVSIIEDPKTKSNEINHSVLEKVSLSKQSQNKSKSKDILQQSAVDCQNTVNQEDKSHNNTQINAQRIINNTSLNKKQQNTSKLENKGVETEKTLHMLKEKNSSTNNITCNYEEDDLLKNLDKSIKNRPIGTDDVRDQDNKDNEQYFNKQFDSNDKVSFEEQTDNIEEEDDGQDEDDNDQNASQEQSNNSEDEIEEEILERDEEDDENNDNEEGEEFNSNEDTEEKSRSYNEEIEPSQKYQGNRSNNEGKQEDQQDENIAKNETLTRKVEQNQHAQNGVNNENFNYQDRNTSQNQNNFDIKDTSIKTPRNTQANVTNDTTCRDRQKQDIKVPSPELILHEKQSQIESFTVQGRNTSVRKTKSIIKNLTIRQSLAPVRESTDFSNGSRNSSAEGSGWDSHRTTRATLRQTFGKDFTPRKSLRALVMEKSAKRQTNFTEMNAEISRLPQANSTELPESIPCAMDQSDIIRKLNDSDEKSRNNSNNEHVIDEFCDTNKFDEDVVGDVNKSNGEKKINETNHDSSQNIDNDNDTQENNESDDPQEMDESDQELPCDVNESDEIQKSSESDRTHEKNESHQNVSSDIDNSGEEPKREESDQTPKTNDSGDTHEMNESVNAHEMNESDNAHEMNESDNAHEMDESDQETSRDIESDQEVSRDSDEEQSHHESDQAHEINESEDEDEMKEPDQESSHNVNDTEEISENDDSQEVNESVHEVSQEFDNDESKMDESTNVQEMDEAENVPEINESDDDQDMHEYDNADDMIESDREFSYNKDSAGVQKMESGHKASREVRQTTLEMYLQKVKKQNIERKKQLEDEIRNSLKAPTRDMLNPFKVPAVPKLSRIKTQQTKPKAKPLKSSVIPLNMLPVEMLEDMKYKPPKRYRPTNASWITKRLYKFLESKLEPKYDYKARVRSEKLVETIYKFTKEVRRAGAAPAPAVDALKHEMARLDVVTTHFEFYEFFHEFMPREVRVKVVPDVFNKISLPKHGIFSNILR